MAFFQPALFEERPNGPDGFAYAPGLVSEGEAQRLLALLAQLHFEPFAFRGFVGRRRVISFGRRYDFNHARLDRAEPPPSWLDSVREAAAAFARLPPTRLEQVLINEYAPGAAIGWHKDRPQFGEVIGVSLGSRALLRFRRRRADGWDRVSAPVEPRSAYVLRGPARREWEHSLPPAAGLRYSITFRTLACAQDRNDANGGRHDR